MTPLHALHTMLAYAFGGLGEIISVRDYDGPGLLVRVPPPLVVRTFIACTCERVKAGRRRIKRTGSCWCLS